MENCLFCSIIQGKTPSLKVYEDNQVLIIMDIRPANKGHVILLPKKHKTSIMELTSSEYNYLMHVLREIIPLLKKVTKCGGVNVIHSIGEEAGQLTPHLLFHVIPRFKNDKVIIHWEPKKLEQKEFLDLQKSLAQAFTKVRKPVIREPSAQKIVKEKPEQKPEEKIKEKLPSRGAGYW